MTRIKLTDIAFDAGTQIREAINDQVVSEYAERMAEGVEFPAVVLFHDGNRYYLADGFHRYMASQRNSFVDIVADVRAGTKEDALWFALGANKANGHRMTDSDKRHAINLALLAWPDRSANQLAEQIGVSQSSVQRAKEQLMRTHNLPDRVTGKDGKSYPTRHKEPSAPQAPEPAFKSREAVAQRRKDIGDMAERGFTTRQIAASIGVSEETVSATAKREGIVIHADRVVGKTTRHDANRIVLQMVMDAENLTADVDLIDFSALDRAQIAGWIESLNASRSKFGAFIKRLMQEQQNGKAA